jgi:hypothetical protein
MVSLHSVLLLLLSWLLVTLESFATFKIKIRRGEGCLEVSVESSLVYCLVSAASDFQLCYLRAITNDAP